MTLRTWGTEDFALVRHLYDTERSQWLSEELEPGVKSIHLQPDRLDMGCSQGDNNNNYSTNLTLRWPGFCGQGAGQTTLKFPFSGVTLHVHTEWLWK